MRGRAVSLRALLDALPDKRTAGVLPETVTGVAYDSRAVQPGDLFVAVPGLRQDGRRFAADALARGAVAVVLEGEDDAGVAAPRIAVPSSRQALARLAGAYYGHPSRALTVVGITGTSGKTTTSYLVEALLRTRGAPVGVIGTIAYRIGGEAVPAGQTTPEAVELQELLARMVERGAGAAVMEVSSHALDLHRVDGVELDVAVFTNLGRDHLDYHETPEAYRRAKARLFALLAAGVKAGRVAVVNADDPAGPSMLAGLHLPVIGFGMGTAAAVRPRQWTSDTRGIRMTVETPAGTVEIASAMVGEHNVMNLLGAVAVGVALGLPREAIGGALSGVDVVPGRFERVEAGQPFLVVVDYAHKPEALEHVLRTARKFAGTGRLGVVFGCGGDRDRGKRPLMGEIAARLADDVWVTSDNPRSEPPEAIVAEVMGGIPAADRTGGRVRAQVDRRAAIRDAIAWARPGDVVIIAGKGHEPYQIIGAQTLPFDDREEARAAIEASRGSR